MTTFGKFASAPIGAGLAASDNGLSLTTNANGVLLNRVARSDVSVTGSQAGFELAFWGTAPLQAAVGVIQTGGSLTAALGSAPESIGWRLDTGDVTQGNASLLSGLPIPALGDIVGVKIDIGAGVITFYRNGVLVGTKSVSLTGFTWHFAASIAAAEAGTLSAAVNAGQWPANSPAAQVGWESATATVAPVYLADVDWLSAATDPVPHRRYEGVLDSDDITIAQSVTFWPWSDRPRSAGGATIRVFDPNGALDPLLTVAAPMPVSIALANADRATALPLALLRFDRAEVESEQVKVLYFVDGDETLASPVAPGVFLPNLPAHAWKTLPAVVGAVANVPTFAASSDGSAQMVADTNVTVTEVRDRGDVMEPGTWSMDPSGQQLNFVSPPRGPVTADVSCIGAGPAAASLQQAMSVLMSRAGSGAWVAADAAALDALTGYGIGYYASDTVSCAVALDRVLASWTAGRYRDAAGNVRLVRLIPPESVSDAALAFDIDDFIEEVVVEPDLAPRLSRTMQYRPNAKPLSAADLVTDIVGLPQADRDRLTAAFQGRVYSAAPLARQYWSAESAEPASSLFWSATHAAAELDRVLALYAAPRNFYHFAMQWDGPLYPGSVGRITFTAANAVVSRKVFVAAVGINPARGVAEVTAWGL